MKNHSTAIEVGAAPVDIWEARPSLARIRDKARARRVGPLALLGVMMLRAIAEVEPRVRIPAFVGTPASLNLFVGLVGPSGGGKNAADNLGAEYWPLDGVPIHPIGTGQGIADVFDPKDRETENGGNPKVTRAIFTAGEIDTLRALGDQKGATLFPTIRGMAMGEMLGAKNAKSENNRRVEAHAYRACLSVGIQPNRAAVLLDDVDGGTPQRFIWLPVNDPEAPENPDADDFLDAGCCDRATFPNDRDTVLTYPPIVWSEIQRHRWLVLKGDRAANPLDGHALLTRAKVAAALMLLDARTEATEDDWRIAGMVMAISDRTRQAIVDQVSESKRRGNRARAHDLDEQETVLADRRMERAKSAVLRALATAPMKPYELRKLARADIRDYVDAALAELHGAGLVALADDGTYTST